MLADKVFEHPVVGPHGFRYVGITDFDIESHIVVCHHISNMQCQLLEHAVYFLGNKRRGTSQPVAVAAYWVRCYVAQYRRQHAVVGKCFVAEDHARSISASE